MCSILEQIIITAVSDTLTQPYCDPLLFKSNIVCWSKRNRKASSRSDWGVACYLSMVFSVTLSLDQTICSPIVG
jgi:hypothetical protein